MVWGSMPKLGTAPPMGREISQIHFFAYNFLLVCQKIMFLGSMDSLGHAESEDVNFAMIGWSTCPPFWNLSWIAISSEPFDISVQKSVGIMNTMSRRYPGSLKTAPPSVPEINKNAYNFWKCCPKCIILMLFRSLGYADSDDVSFVIFQHGVCQPFWSKWKTVFSLLLLQNLSNSYQNWLRWSLDRAAQKWLNRIFWLLVKKKVMMLWTTRSTPKLVHRPYLGQTLINRNETWYASSTPWSEDTCQSWEQRHLWVVRYQKCTFSDITFEQSVSIL